MDKKYFYSKIREIVKNNLPTYENIYLSKYIKFEKGDVDKNLKLVLNETQCLPKELMTNKRLDSKSNHDGILCNYEELRYNLFADIVKHKGNIIQEHALDRKILIEYSSPNIAKPFHAGHLRSTLIGNFISNLNTFLGYNVTRINYYGDWGTQLGLLLLAINSQAINLNDINLQKMFEAYAHINKLAEQDDKIRIKAKDILSEMEKGNEDFINQMDILKKISLGEYERLYKTLGVIFDENEYESQYYKDAPMIINHLNKLGKIINRDGAKLFEMPDGSGVVVEKDDGSSLYAVRDVCAALKRIATHSPDEMIYVVENGQYAHFKLVFEMLNHFPLTRHCKFRHVPFGRISGMQTRKGNVVFVEDILDRCKALTMTKLKNSQTTKKGIDMDAVAQNLGVSSVIVNVLKQNRLTNYHFDWYKAIDFKGNSGNLLQYTHARLRSLERTFSPNDGSPPQLTIPNFPALSCDDRSRGAVDELVLNMMRFQGSVQSSLDNFEPSIYLNHLFQYCHSINLCYQHLNVRGVPEETAQARLNLFACSRSILKRSIKLLGIEPLDEM